MAKHPSISQYLISTCLFIIDELNELYGKMDKSDLKQVADTKFNEMDFTVKIGYPFRQMAHYTVGDTVKRELAKSNHDIYIESKDFKIEIKYLKNWENATGTFSNSATWNVFQSDFNWLFKEIDDGEKHKRAFLIGWFNSVERFAQLIQLGESSGSKPLASEEKICYFPFLHKTKHPTYTTDLIYDYNCAYESRVVKPIGENHGEYNCIFVGNENDVFHFAIYY